MHYIIVDVKIPGEAEKELKIPSFITAGELLDLLSQIFHIKTRNMTIHAEPPGRILGKDEYLDEANVWDGALITLTEF